MIGASAEGAADAQDDQLPVWFWFLAILRTLWGIVGVAAYHIDLATTAADQAALDA